MRILLLGEYSRLHNTLKEGLLKLDHEVLLVGSGDGFKKFPVDISIKEKISLLPVVSLFRKALYKIFKYDISEFERGINFYFNLKKFKNFDVVQLINEKPTQTTPWLERYLLKKIIAQNKKIFLLSCGADTFYVTHSINKKEKYSALTPLFENPDLKEKFRYMFNYLKKGHKKTHNLLINNISGIIASDFDYVLPLKDHPLFKGIIPNPVNLDKLCYSTLKIDDKITIFLGINSGNYHSKGIEYFEKALEKIEKKFSERINIITTKDVPYKKYIKLHESAHIILDQIYAYDQGYNALETMAVKKVVFTGAETPFLNYYKLSPNEVCINALPDVDYLENKLTYLIENPEKIIEIGENARKFIMKEHDYIFIAKKYLDIYNS